MSLNPDVTSVTSFTILNSGLDDLSSSTLRYRYRPVASSKKSRFLRLLHYIVFKVRVPVLLGTCYSLAKKAARHNFSLRYFQLNFVIFKF